MLTRKYEKTPYASTLAPRPIFLSQNRPASRGWGWVGLIQKRPDSLRQTLYPALCQQGDSQFGFSSHDGASHSCQRKWIRIRVRWIVGFGNVSQHDHLSIA